MTTRFICISFDPLESQSSAGVQLLVAPNPAVGDPWSNLCERRDFFKRVRGRRVLPAGKARTPGTTWTNSKLADHFHYMGQGNDI